MDDYVRTRPSSWPRRRTEEGELPIVPPAVRAAAADADGNLWISLSVPYTYVYDTRWGQDPHGPVPRRGRRVAALALLHARPAGAGHPGVLRVPQPERRLRGRAAGQAGCLDGASVGVTAAEHPLNLGDQRVRQHGLVTNESQPACRAPSACPARAWPVSATIGMCRVRSSSFRRRVASQPSIRGSAKSIRMMSGRSSTVFSMASRPLVASATRYPETADTRRTSRAHPGSPRRQARAVERSAS